jgi:hypothetical protein
LVTRIC